MNTPSPADSRYLQPQHYQTVRNVHRALQSSGVGRLTFSFLDSQWKELKAVHYELDQLPEGTFNELVEVIARLGEARNELRLALFLFDVEEINPVWRLVMRNRAVLRGKQILEKVLLIWPLASSSEKLRV